MGKQAVGDVFPIIYEDFKTLFSSGGYFGYAEKPDHIKKYMAVLNKDIIARNNAKIQAAKDEGRDPPKLGKGGPPYGPDQLEPENTTCVIQVSQGLNASSQKVPGQSSERVNPAIPGGNGFYLQNVRELTAYLTDRYGTTPNLVAMARADDNSTPQEYIQGRKGILTFGTAHTEFFNGTTIVQSGKINEENNHVTQPMGWPATWGQADIRFWEIRPKGSKGAAANAEASWLDGWWTVWDGQTYYYHFAYPYVVYIKTKPKSAAADRPWTFKNKGTITSISSGGCVVLWNKVAGVAEQTKETYKVTEPGTMMGQSQYGWLRADKGVK